MKIYLASNNEHKKKEMQEIFSDYEIVIPKDEGIEFNPEENGKTFYENSIIKASALFEKVHSAVIADDSGICVDALNGRPGIFSARYAGKNFPNGLPCGTKISQSEQNSLLIDELNDALLQKKQNTNFALECNSATNNLQSFRSCHYTCAMVLFLGHDRIFFAQETMEGFLVEKIEDAKGSGGFGYDPLVILPNGKSVAELSETEKNEISHRGKAAKSIKKILEILKLSQ